MIPEPEFSSHFIQRAEERAPWLLQGNAILTALSMAWVVDRYSNIHRLLKYGDDRAVFLVVPKLSKKRTSVVLVMENNQLITVYKTHESNWAMTWLSRTPESDRVRYAHTLQEIS